MNEPTIKFDRVLIKGILESYYTGQCFENGGGDWMATEFCDSKLNVSNADYVSVQFHHGMLQHHGCFMEMNTDELSQLPHKLGIQGSVDWTLSWRGFELLESLSGGK